MQDQQVEKNLYDLVSEDELHVFRSWLNGLVELPNWVIYSIPDAAWMWSLTSFFAYLWKDVPERNQKMYISGVVILGLGTEIAQAFGVLTGVFDWMDLGLMMLSAALSYYCMSGDLTVPHRVGEEV